LSRPNCSVKGCINLSDYCVYVQNGCESSVRGTTLIVKPIFEAVELCAKHHSLFEEAFKEIDITKVPDKTREKVQFT
jgi:hypothetical protein